MRCTGRLNLTKYQGLKGEGVSLEPWNFCFVARSKIILPTGALIFFACKAWSPETFFAEPRAQRFEIRSEYPDPVVFVFKGSFIFMQDRGELVEFDKKSLMYNEPSSS